MVNIKYKPTPELVGSAVSSFGGSVCSKWNGIPFVFSYISWGKVDAAMETYQWFLLGVMVAWTPGLLALALMLRRHHTIDSADNSSW